MTMSIREVGPPEPDLDPIFRFPRSISPRNEQDLVNYVELFFHDELFSTIVEHTNAVICDESEHVTLEEMCSAVLLE